MIVVVLYGFWDILTATIHPQSTIQKGHIHWLWHFHHFTARHKLVTIAVLHESVTKNTPGHPRENGAKAHEIFKSIKVSSIIIDTPSAASSSPFPPQMSTGLSSSFLWSCMESREQQPCMGSGHGRPHFSTSDSNIAAEATQTCTPGHHARTYTQTHTHTITLSLRLLYLSGSCVLLSYLTYVSPLPTLDVWTRRPPHSTRAIIDPHLPNLSTSHRDLTHPIAPTPNI